MNIILGSTSVHKLTAVREACENLGIQAFVHGVKTSSGQNEQPVGFAETFEGALTRAKSAQTQCPNIVAIGIESGVFHFVSNRPITMDIAIIVILTKDGRQIIMSSSGIEFPEECVKIAEDRGFKTTTVGSVIAERFGGDPTDPYSILTNGKVTRLAVLMEALMLAIKQI